MKSEKIILLGKDFKKARFDSIANHPCQSWEYGLFMERLGNKVLRLATIKNDRLTSVFQIYLVDIPKTDYKIAHAPKSIFPSSELLSDLKKLLIRERVVFLRIEPYITEPISKIPLTKLIIKSPDSLNLNYTIKVDLTIPAEKVFQNLKTKTKYNIRLAQKYGVQIREMTNENGFKIFSNLFFATCIRKGFYSHSFNYQQKLFDNLKNKISHILVAFYQNKPLAAYQLFIFNNGAYFPFGGSDYENRKFMATNLLMWESLMYSKKSGALYFDFYETLAADYNSDHPWAGLTKFALGYGGKFVKFIDNYDFVVNSNLYKDYSNLISNSSTIVSGVIMRNMLSLAHNSQH